MTTENEALRKRAEDLAGFILFECAGEFETDDITNLADKLLAFAAEQSALAREAAIIECAAACETRANSIGEGSAVARQCAKDIIAKGVFPAGDRVLVPRVPTAEMLWAGACVNITTTTTCEGQPVCGTENAAAIYAAMLAAAGKD